MSMASAIAAEIALSIVRRSIERAKKEATTEEAVRLLQQVLEECEKHISE